MKYKKLIALPILGLALSNLANAGQVPIINSISSSNNGASFAVPLATDFSFNQRNLSVSVAATGTGYQLTAIGAPSSNFTFYGWTPGSAYSGTTSGSGYSLTANFDIAGAFVPTGSKLTVTGSLSTAPVGSVGAASGLLYDADLTDFGFNAAQADIAFKTKFNPSWSNQPLFTGGSAGEVIYLYDQIGLASGRGNLSALTRALAAGNLGSVAGQTFSRIESIATVPLPLPAVLFGTGLTALIGFTRKRLSVGKEI